MTKVILDSWQVLHPGSLDVCLAQTLRQQLRHRQGAMKSRARQQVIDFFGDLFSVAHLSKVVVEDCDSRHQFRSTCLRRFAATLAERLCLSGNASKTEAMPQAPGTASSLNCRAS